MKTLLSLLLSAGFALASGPLGELWNQSASFTRPGDTTAYASGDLVANSTTAGSVVPLSFSRGAGGVQFQLARLKLHKSGTSVTLAQFRIHLFKASPTVANGDNAAFSTSQVANSLGSFDVTMTQAFTDGAAVFISTGANDIVSDALYALIEARAAYAPGNAEVFTLSIEAAENR